VSKITRYAIPRVSTKEVYQFELPLSYHYRILGFGENFLGLPWVDVLETDNKKELTRFIVVPLDVEWVGVASLRRKCLGSFIAPNSKQCYVFEGGMVGV